MWLAMSTIYYGARLGYGNIYQNLIIKFFAGNTLAEVLQSVGRIYYEHLYPSKPN